MQAPERARPLPESRHEHEGHPGRRPTVNQDIDRRQLDLFVDGRDALVIHEIVSALLARDVGRAETGLRRLRRDHPRHVDLAALTALGEALRVEEPVLVTHATLTERIEATERALAPAARRLLGQDAAIFMRSRWDALAALALHLPFDSTHPRAHRAWLCQQHGAWAEVRDAVEAEPDWAATGLLRYWLGLARHHLGAPEAAIRLWLPLCWIDPPLFARYAPSLPDATIRDGWEAFERADLFERLLADPTAAAPWFPAWLLARHRGLARLFRADELPDTGHATRVFRHLLSLVPLEQHGLSDELIGQRRALQQLDPDFFRCYMETVGQRRRFP
jgi:hypothetical protein